MVRLLREWLHKHQFAETTFATDSVSPGYTWVLIAQGPSSGWSLEVVENALWTSWRIALGNLPADNNSNYIGACQRDIAATITANLQEALSQGPCQP